jgi:hypothetical protein
MSANPMDDVDRLFECFKCGFSPPRKLSFLTHLRLVTKKTLKTKGNLSSTVILVYSLFRSFYGLKLLIRASVEVYFTFHKIELYMI